MTTLSPQGYYYRFDPNAPTGERLTRKRRLDEPWSYGFSLQTMTAEEIWFVVGVIDEARVSCHD